MAFDRWRPKDDTYTHPIVGKVHVHPTPGAQPAGQVQAVPLTEEAIWNSDDIMACNTGLMMLDLVNLVRAVERAHGITGKAAPVAQQYPVPPGHKFISDFETHPAGTMRRIAQLEQEVAACERRLADMAREMQKFMDEAQQRR